MNPTTRTATILLACGPAYALLYVVTNDVVAAALIPSYDPMSQAVSELSAIGSPARLFLLAMVPVSTGLLAAFGLGVRRAAGGRRALRVAGDLLVATAAVGLLWLPFPMTARADMVPGAMSVNDVGHIALTVVTVLLITAQIATAAAAFGTGVRVYSAVTIAATLGFGALTGVLVGDIAAGGATPWMGFTERVGIGAWLLWMVVLAALLLREGRVTRPGVPVPPSTASAGPS
ncbi:DUF998 domain-containing protein [Pseudonocardia sp.]|uniref:DUF998 domain-containing protein n=1 Tax=Pseudonocardia sp. TaxID=60912 RepID=UPI003D0FD298